MGEKTRKSYVVLTILVISIGIGVSLWYALMLISSFQQALNASSVYSQNPYPTSYNTSYTSLLIESYDENSRITFGDTEYFFGYMGDADPRVLYIDATLSPPVTLYPEIGHSYWTVGMEIEVVNMSSNSILVNVRPAVENYMFDTYQYTRVEIPFEQAPSSQNGTVTVSLTSSTTNRTNQYAFEYPFGPSIGPAPTHIKSATLIVKTSSQSKQYEAVIGVDIRQAEYDFNIAIRIYQANSNFMVIYVKPLY
jgi:hypothetical protein